MVLGFCCGGRLGNLGGLPGGKQVEGVGARRAGLGGVDGESEVGVGDHVDALVGELEVTDDGVVEELAASTVEADVVAAPAATKLAAARGEFANEVVQVPVVRVAAGLGVQDGDAGVGCDVP